MRAAGISVLLIPWEMILRSDCSSLARGRVGWASVGPLPPSPRGPWQMARDDRGLFGRSGSGLDVILCQQRCRGGDRD